MQSPLHHPAASLLAGPHGAPAALAVPLLETLARERHVAAVMKSQDVLASPMFQQQDPMGPHALFDTLTLDWGGATQPADLRAKYNAFLKTLRNRCIARTKPQQLTVNPDKAFLLRPQIKPLPGTRKGSGSGASSGSAYIWMNMYSYNLAQLKSSKKSNLPDAPQYIVGFNKPAIPYSWWWDEYILSGSPVFGSGPELEVQRRPGQKWDAEKKTGDPDLPSTRYPAEGATMTLTRATYNEAVDFFTQNPPQRTKQRKAQEYMEILSAVLAEALRFQDVQEAVSKAILNTADPSSALTRESCITTYPVVTTAAGSKQQAVVDGVHFFTSASIGSTS